MKNKILSILFLFYTSLASGYDFDAMFSNQGSENNTSHSIKIDGFMENVEKEQKKISESERRREEYLEQLAREQRNSGGNVGRCYSINNEDIQNSCIAIVKREVSMCYSIKNNNTRNNCIAIVKHEESMCYSINNEDMQNSCIAIVKREVSMCYSINNKNTRNNCIAIVKHEESMCYSINNEDVQNNCIASVQ
ncbi:MAG: hypothetical protein QM504_12850 [Pseudomonadota bacterium]